MDKGKLIGLAVLAVFFLIIIYFFVSAGSAKWEVPSYITGEVKEIYEWAATEEGKALLEDVPCYCGCKFEGHSHARHCFWRDDGTFDKHGVTCAVCLDIAKRTKKMSEEGKDICEVRKTIDMFYEPNKHLGTETPMPEGCV